MKVRFNSRSIQLLIFNYSLLILSACSVNKQIAKSAKADVLDAKALQTAHIGISIFDPAANKYLYNYQGDKYFIPASNTKLPTCYAAMKYLGDSLVGLRYGIPEEKGFKENVVVVRSTGDPTFLHEEYLNQPSFDFLKKVSKEKQKTGFVIGDSKIERWGSGWSWNDYDAAYMVERNTFPIFGNVINIKLNDVENRNASDDAQFSGLRLKLFRTGSSYLDSIVNDIPLLQSVKRKQFLNPTQNWTVNRSIENNRFSVERATRPFSSISIPFVTYGITTATQILKDTLHKAFRWVVDDKNNKYMWDEEGGDITMITINNWHKIHSQPTDSLLKPMMHRSDNFFAEQSLLMVSNEMLGVMNDEKIIDTLLKTDFSDLPQKPRWVDGSGLSRYNLFTPQDFVAILNKMKNEFGMERLKVILPTGGEGTISSYYKTDSGYIYGKTGTLSGVVAFSGFLYTKKGKLLIFSTLVNNHQASAIEVRRAMEKFLQGVRNKY
jgi:serine-type D-Ala-D-Ala carboxypeptidase/endopeptidase (penicillin-binding protein 4)